MEVKRGTQTQFSPQPRTVTIGEFDGLHLGHRKIIKKTLSVASQTETAPSVITFEKQYPALSTTGEKLQMMESCGLELALMLPPEGEWKRWSAEYFIDEYLMARMKAVNIVVGEDFKFGRSRGGNTDTLKSFRTPDFRAHIVPVEKKEGRKISSSRIRELLKEGKLEQCRHLLGRNYFFTGKIIPGKKLGRKLGFPTLNFSLPEEKILPPGVFLCRALTDDDRREPAHYGLCFIPNSPPPGEKKAEVHFIGSPVDDNKKIRGAELLQKISRVQKLSNRNKLIEKISSDVEKAKEILNRSNLT